MDYDLLIRGGTIVDGSGSPAFRGDVAVAGGKIAAVGKVDGSAKRTIEADGRAVTPGFVDVHTHYDAQVFWDRMLTISPWHGVTTVVMGNCGFGIAPTRAAERSLIVRTLENVEGMSRDALEAGLGEDWPFETFPEFLDAIERRGTAINIAALVGHTPVRLYVMGEAATERAATADEITRMAALVGQALEAGARRLRDLQGADARRLRGPSGAEPRRRARRDRSAREHAATVRHGIMQATFGPGFFLDEFASLARASGRPVTWTALLTGLRGPGGHRPSSSKAESCRPRASPCTRRSRRARSTSSSDWKAPFPFESMSVFKPVSAADAEGKKRLYADPDFRADDSRAHRRQGIRALRGALVAHARLRYAPNDPELEERLVVGDRRGARRPSGRSGARPRARVGSRGALPHGGAEHRRTERRRAASAHSGDDARPVRRRRAREPALRRVLRDRPARPLGARQGRALARGRGPAL